MVTGGQGVMGGGGGGGCWVRGRTGDRAPYEPRESVEKNRHITST